MDYSVNLPELCPSSSHGNSEVYQVHEINDQSIERVHYDSISDQWVSWFMSCHAQLESIIPRLIEAARVKDTSVEALLKWFETLFIYNIYQDEGDLNQSFLPLTEITEPPEPQNSAVSGIPQLHLILPFQLNFLNIYLNLLHRRFPLRYQLAQHIGLFLLRLSNQGTPRLRQFQVPRLSKSYPPIP